MKALFVYSKLTGTKRYLRHIPYVIKMLRKHFESFKAVETHNYRELKKICLNAAENYDYLIFSGGDGAINAVVNIIAPLKKRPILGYIPMGTTNDFAHNFGLKRNIKSSIKTIVKGVPVPFDIFKVNECYGVYVLATGAFSEISYSTKKKDKEKIGQLAYHLLGAKNAFIPKRVFGTLKANNKTYDVNTPFLLILNSVHVGGFYVDLRNKVNDGKITIYFSKPGLLNGIFHYAFFKKGVTRIETDAFSFRFKDKISAWCLDGDKKNFKNIDVKCLHSHLQLLVSRKVAKKYKL